MVSVPTELFCLSLPRENREESSLQPRKESLSENNLAGWHTDLGLLTIRARRNNFCCL
jgi:hypothetical protein